MTDQRPMPRILVVLLCTAGTVVTLAGIREVGSIVGPTLLALVLVLAVSPVRTWLQRHGAPGWALIAVPLTIVLVVLLGMVAILTIAIAQMAALAPTYDTQFNQLIGALDNCAQKTRRYLLVSTVFGLVCSALDLTALWLLGVPLPCSGVPNCLSYVQLSSYFLGVSL
jgi:predicted PurR-regulated permease PerM